MGDFESPADVADAVQGEAGGSWSYAGRNLHYGVREEGANLPELDALSAPFDTTFVTLRSTQDA